MISGWRKPIPALKLRSKARLVVVGADGCRALLEMEVNTEDMMRTAIMVMKINKVITSLIGHQKVRGLTCPTSEKKIAFLEGWRSV